MLRIVKTRYKLLYTLTCVLLIGAVAPAWWGPPWTLVSIVIGNVIFLAFLIVGVRSFRGRGEPVAPKRAWWRLTARPTAGFVIAGVSAWFALGFVVSIVLGTDLGPLDMLDAVINIVLMCVLVLAYLNSSLRLLSAKRRTAAQP